MDGERTKEEQAEQTAKGIQKITRRKRAKDTDNFQSR
jgi:hypothetical protein